MYIYIHIHVHNGSRKLIIWNALSEMKKKIIMQEMWKA